MPHDGSACATALNPLIASPNQNECSSATARSNCACSAGLHEVGKLTFPRRSGACAPARGIEAPSQMAKITIPVPTASVRVLSMATSVPGAFHTALRVRKGLARVPSSLAPQLLNRQAKEIAMANRRKPSIKLPDPRTVTETAIDAGVRAVEAAMALTQGFARGFARGAMMAGRATSDGVAQATEETTKAASDVVRDAARRVKRAAPRARPGPRRAPGKSRSGRRAA